MEGSNQESAIPPEVDDKIKLTERFSGFKVNQKIKVLRSSGEIEDGWFINNLLTYGDDNKPYAIVRKIKRELPVLGLDGKSSTEKDYLEKTIPISELSEWQK